MPSRNWLGCALLLASAVAAAAQTDTASYTPPPDIAK